MRLANTDPTALAANAGGGDRALLELTNVDLLAGHRMIPKETIAVTWERVLDGERLRLSDQLTIINLGLDPVAFPITIAFDAGFEDVFTVRALLDEQSGRLSPLEWHGGTLVFRYAGADRLERTLRIECSSQPARQTGTAARWNMQLEGRASQDLRLELTVSEAVVAGGAGPAPQQHSLPVAQETELDKPPDRGRQWTRVTSDSLLLNRLFERSANDLEMLRSSIGHETFFAAGLPWFGTLFGRDSLITALETLAYDPASRSRRCACWRGGKARGWTPGATSSPAKSCKSCAWARWRTRAKSRIRPITGPSTPRRSS